jgi:Zn-dependent protease with chaperone function
MTRTLARLMDNLEVPAPAAVGMVLITAILAKGGHSILALPGMIVLVALSALVRNRLARSSERRAPPSGARVATGPELSLAPTELAKSPRTSPGPSRDPGLPATSPNLLREAA